ncbi:MAG: hypothetical protein EAZ54_14130, partial [Curvibacter sp.]
MQSIGTAPHLNSRQFAATSRGGLGEFFRYHGIWAPGVRLFRAIGFRAKAMVISAIFLLPIALLAWNYFTAQAAAIEFSAKERLGVVYAKDVMPLLNLLQRQRLAVVQAAAKGPASDTVALRADIDKQQARLLATDKLHGEALGTAKALAAFVQAGQTAGAASGGVDALFAAHSAHIQALLD